MLLVQITQQFVNGAKLDNTLIKANNTPSSNAVSVVYEVSA